VYYRIFENGLAMESKEAFDLTDLSIGRVLSSRVGPQLDVGTFMTAIAQLESIPESRFQSLHFDTNGPPINDDFALSATQAVYPGVTPDRPLLCCLSKVINGVADPVLDPLEDGRVKYPDCPSGWITVRARQVKSTGSAPYFQSVAGRTTALRPRQHVFIDATTELATTIQNCKELGRKTDVAAWLILLVF
ncbi:hypothetical protein DL93DRAFT_2066750, partial [Clavulina sp. PMI_390]